MPRHPPEPDCTPFADLMREALDGYRQDPELAVAMVHRASLILRRRRTWQARMDLRAAEREAMADCRASAPFTCDSDTPVCGVGSCRYSVGEFAKLAVVAASEVSRCSAVERPQRTSSGATAESCIETAVAALVEQRASGPVAV